MSWSWVVFIISPTQGRSKKVSEIADCLPIVGIHILSVSKNQCIWKPCCADVRLIAVIKKLVHQFAIHLGSPSLFWNLTQQRSKDFSADRRCLPIVGMFQCFTNEYTCKPCCADIRLIAVIKKLGFWLVHQFATCLGSPLSSLLNACH